MIDSKTKAQAMVLINKIIGDKCGSMESVKPIHNGYTNASYLVTYSDGSKFQVRLPHCGELINRSAEAQMIEILKDKSFIYFDVKTGNAVRKWIDGKCPRIFRHIRWHHIDKLFILIRQLHLVPLTRGHKFKKIDFDGYNENLYRLKLEYQTKYLSIVDSCRDDEHVLSHTDINAQNMILDNQGMLHLIDYEWCALANDYWDYANFIREAGITWYEQIDWKQYIPKFDMVKLKNLIFAACVYSYLWTWKMPQTRKIKRYRRKVMKQMHIFSRGVIDNEK